MDERTEECPTMYLSQELREARAKRGHDPTASPDTDCPSFTYRPGPLQQIDHKGLRVRRCFGSTDLLHHVHLLTHQTHSSLSLDSLEESLPLHSNSSAEHRMEHQPPSATEVQLKGSKLSLDDIMLPAGGEGNNSKGANEIFAEEEDSWEDARESDAQTEEESSWSVDDDNEEPEEEENCTKAAQTDYMQFHSIPQGLIPSEITHCLFELEKEWRGVERERESVIWKMEMIHRSVQTAQEILKKLLTHLVDTRIFNTNSNKASQPAHFSTHKTGMCTSTNGHFLFTSDKSHHGSQPHTSSHHVVTQTNAHTHTQPQPHPHCHAARTVSRRPSEMCLFHPTHDHPSTYCPGISLEPPSCAQHKKEKIEGFHVLTELREGLKQVHLAQEKECNNQKEILSVLHGLQQQIGSLHAHQHSERECEVIGAQHDHLRQQTSKIKNMVQHAISVFSRVGVKSEEAGTVQTEVQSASAEHSDISPTNRQVNDTYSALWRQQCEAEFKGQDVEEPQDSWPS